MVGWFPGAGLHTGGAGVQTWGAEMQTVRPQASLGQSSEAIDWKRVGWGRGGVGWGVRRDVWV